MVMSKKGPFLLSIKKIATYIWIVSPSTTPIDKNELKIF